MSSIRRWRVELNRTVRTTEYTYIEVIAESASEAGAVALRREEQEYLDWDSHDSDYDSPEVADVVEIESEEEEEDSEEEDEETPEEPPEEEVKF